MIEPSNIKVAVLMGGFSAERDVSLRSGQAAAAALRSRGCRVEEIDVRDRRFSLPTGIHVAFVALHGTGGEDGMVQAVLEKKGIPFTGSGSEASRRAFDKAEAKRLFRATGLLTPQDVVLRRNKRNWKKDGLPFGFPLVVKPSCQGSSIGIHIVQRPEKMREAITDAFRNDAAVLVEEFIAGRELTVGILGGRALPVIEIRPKSGWYDYQNKYTRNATEYLVPAPIEAPLCGQVQQIAQQAHLALGCRDISRSDFRLTPDHRIYLLEVNTIPGMTETSLLPKAAAADGIDFPGLCLTLVELALNRGRNRS